MFVPLEFLAFAVLFLMIFTGNSHKQYKWKRFGFAALIMAVVQIILIGAGILITDKYFKLEDNVTKVVIAAIVISGFLGLLISGKIVRPH